MVGRTKFRKVLPASQTALAVLFGGWGLWIRNSILSQPFFGSSTLWNSTARFHVWPWPFKFAAILDMPAFLASSLLSWPLDYLRPGLPEWVSALPVLLLVWLLWYCIGSWTDKNVSSEKNKNGERWTWIFLLLFIFVCAAASSISGFIGGYTSYLVFGIAIWSSVVAMGVKTSTARNRKSKVA
jgi:hypothetical protein